MVKGSHWVEGESEEHWITSPLASVIITTKGRLKEKKLGSSCVKARETEIQFIQC